MRASIFLIKTLLTAVFIAVSVACSQFPVQELSDARQALEAAEDAGAEERAQDDYTTAKNLLQEAEFEVDAGAYRDAGDTALRAKSFALRARLRAATRH